MQKKNRNIPYEIQNGETKKMVQTTDDNFAVCNHQSKCSHYTYIDRATEIFCGKESGKLEMEHGEVRGYWLLPTRSFQYGGRSEGRTQLTRGSLSLNWKICSSVEIWKSPFQFPQIKNFFLTRKICRSNDPFLENFYFLSGKFEKFHLNRKLSIFRP